MKEKRPIEFGMITVKEEVGLKYFGDSYLRPSLRLTPLARAVVNPKTQGEYFALMRIYECGGFRWNSEHLPTSEDLLNQMSPNKNTCIEGKENKIKYGSVKFCDCKDFKIISLQEFYDIQKIRPEKLEEINKYFELKKLIEGKR